MDKKEIFEVPIPVGGEIYEKDFPQLSQMVIGYRTGRMMGEELGDYEDDGYEDGMWYIQFARGGMETSAPVSEIGVSLFRTRDEAIRAAMQAREESL